MMTHCADDSTVCAPMELAGTAFRTNCPETERDMTMTSR